MDHKYIYIAGPMRGYPKFNFDAFEAAATELEGRGIKIISPHRMDIEIGFNPCVDACLDNFNVSDCIRRDVEAILSTEACVFLSGWEYSVGANAEKMIAEWIHHPCYTYPDFILLPSSVPVKPIT